MSYKSTRGGEKGIGFSEAVLKGIAADGGLFVPEQDIKFDSLELAEMCEMDYKALAAHIFRRYAEDLTDGEIEYCVDRAYGSGSRFDGRDPAPLTRLNETLSVLELWHGPTAAFKDMALQVLPAFMSVALKKRQDNAGGSSGSTAQNGAAPFANEKIAILTATSGDTGKAAMEGFRDAEGIDIMVFFPENGVSEMQRTQMQTQEGKNVRVAAVRGNFDDAQTGVKKIFGDDEFKALLKECGYRLSSANSINIGRLIPQVVYYFHAYFSLVRAERINLGAPVNFVVPTGNFGDILAAYYAYKNGLPIGRLICATNSNSVVSDFIHTGFYNANREFKVTISPAMDILISSNLERLVYDMSCEDEKTTSKLMAELSSAGCYNVDRSTLSGISSLFWSDSSTEEETRRTISDVWNQYDYLIDPHTAVGVNVFDKYVISTGDLTPTVAVATASPFKFNGSVAESIFDCPKDSSEFAVQQKLSEMTGLDIPLPLRGLDKKPLLHTGVCDKDEMKDAVLEFLLREDPGAERN
jgi:threonine synthase